MKNSQELKRNNYHHLLQQAHFISTLSGIDDLMQEPAIIRGLRSLFWNTLDSDFALKSGENCRKNKIELFHFLGKLQKENMIHMFNLESHAHKGELDATHLGVGSDLAGKGLLCVRV
jgi:hypothetical protein